MQALVLIADGTEEMEAVIVIDVLRRAKWSVTVAAVGDTRAVTASRGVNLTADTLFADTDPMEPDILILPGGAGGTEVFCKTPNVLDALRQRQAAGRWIGAICAAPLALQAAGILETHRFTCHPGVRDMAHTGTHTDDRVVTDANLITSQGPGTAFEFALAIIGQLESPAAAAAVSGGLILPGAPS